MIIFYIHIDRIHNGWIVRMQRGGDPEVTMAFTEAAKLREWLQHFPEDN